MALRNSIKAYGSIAKWFHWGTAILLVISYCTIYYREWFADSDLKNSIAIQLHFSVGITLLGIILMRIVWRLLNKTPNQATHSVKHQHLVKIGHIALYAVILIMPISGYLSLGNYLTCNNGNINYFFISELTFLKSPAICIKFSSILEFLEEPADIVHSITGEWLVTALVFGHILLVLYYQFVRKENILKKMTTQKS